MQSANGRSCFHNHAWRRSQERVLLHVVQLMIFAWPNLALNRTHGRAGFWFLICPEPMRRLACFVRLYGSSRTLLHRLHRSRPRRHAHGGTRHTESSVSNSLHYPASFRHTGLGLRSIFAQPNLARNRTPVRVAVWFMFRSARTGAGYLVVLGNPWAVLPVHRLLCFTPHNPKCFLQAPWALVAHAIHRVFRPPFVRLLAVPAARLDVPNRGINSDGVCRIDFVSVLFVIHRSFPFLFIAAGIAGYAHR